VGGMVVAGPEGFNKKAYRTYNIKNVALTPGDDYGMLREVLTRRFEKMLSTDDGAKTKPDLVLIDGGAGQLAVAVQVMEALGISDVPLVAISKGPQRNAGREWFHMPGKEPFQLPATSGALHYLQRLRDEAHRFAIGTHRNKRSNATYVSELDAILAIGPRRKKALLHHFGSVRAISAASVEQIAQAPGISKDLATKIHNHFHS
jgi:excinuclease ABC subunit C